MKKILISGLIISIFIIVSVNITYLRGKSIPANMKDYIGYDYNSLPKNLKSKGVEFKLTEEDQIIEILIHKRGLVVDSIQAGDSIDKIYEVYPKEWINTRKYTIEIISGKENNYGVVTNYTIFTISKDKKVQSILLGKTIPFLKHQLIESNQKAKELIEGEWISNEGHKLSFKSYTHKDNFLDSLWDKQSYIIVSPNSLMIYRNKDSRSEKVKLYFNIVDEKLYLFTINKDGQPIKESIEVFYKL